MAEEVLAGKIAAGGVHFAERDEETGQLVTSTQVESLKKNGFPPGSVAETGVLPSRSHQVVLNISDESETSTESPDASESGISESKKCENQAEEDLNYSEGGCKVKVDGPKDDVEWGSCVVPFQPEDKKSTDMTVSLSPPAEASVGNGVGGGAEESIPGKRTSFACPGTSSTAAAAASMKTGRGFRLLGGGGDEDGNAPATRPLSFLCLCGDAFEDPLVEHLYQSYSVKQKRVDVQCFLCASILLGVHCLVTVQLQEEEAAALSALPHGWSPGIEVVDIQEDIPGDFVEPTWGFRLFLLNILTGVFLFTNAALLIWCRRYAGGGAAGCLGCCYTGGGTGAAGNPAATGKHEIEEDPESGTVAAREKKRRGRDHSSPAKPPLPGSSPSKPRPGNPPREMISALAARVRRAVGRHRPPSSASSSVDADHSSGSALFSWAWSCVPHVAWHLANYQLLAPLFLQGAPGSGASAGSVEDPSSANAAVTSSLYSSPTPRDGLPAALLLVFLLFAALPLRLRYCLVLSAGTCSAYTVAVAGLARGAPNLVSQVLANCLLLFTANILGLASFRLADSQRRRAFMQTSNALQMKLLLEEQSQEQERLLLSVLPEHVAVKMRQDLGSVKDGQFKKIYMSRHENVSILYADIVGFTAISSTYSASELVKILNELFARFDRLAERYQQLRIKILGDCYYCISGAPTERPDHALLCVKMGLSMVKAIEYVQRSTKSPVDMRVGIHTGAVLAGILGQRQWQFDVYSKDVELANRMESSGLPGRVHISDRTLSFLDGQFEVEPAYGERREEALRIAGLKTYFIVKPESKGDEDLGSKGIDDRGGRITEVGGDVLGGGKAEGGGEEDEEEKEEEEDEEEEEEGKTKDEDEFKRRLRQDLINRDGHRELAKHINFFTLSFRDPQAEREYHRHKESFSGASVLALPFVLLLAAAAQLIVLPRGIVNIVSTVAGFILLSAFSLVMAAESLPPAFTAALYYICKGYEWHCGEEVEEISLSSSRGSLSSNQSYISRSSSQGLPKPLVKASEGLNSSIWMRRLTGIIVIAILATANLADMACCEWPQPNTNCTIEDRTPEGNQFVPGLPSSARLSPASNSSGGSVPVLARFARRVVGEEGPLERGDEPFSITTKIPTILQHTTIPLSKRLEGEEGPLERGDEPFSITTNIPTILQHTTIPSSKGFDLVSACPHPTYFTATAVLILSASSLISHLPQGWKTALMAVVATAHCLLLVLLHTDEQVDCAPLGREATGSIQERYTLSGLLLAVTIALAFLNRHTEKASRLLFLWRREVEERRERASEMRRRNEALVSNVLPPHVASHFLGGRRRSHDELYSQSYAEVGVLFASMPNFSDFYSEESVNNQGLECLRFLNEVISDFDALLERPPFQDIIKIKTIGSTYMAASGLNPSHSVKPDDPHLVRWAHLALLVDFAFELKSALTGINEQSFNHFVLKMGINHGPITAGVIGARKPHYDIWGNSVNVASRMESTGKAGCIQVTEETSEILRPFGYTFEQRGLVSVKGKGQLMTYYLIGKEARGARKGSGGAGMSTVTVEDPVSAGEKPAAGGGWEAAGGGLE